MQPVCDEFFDPIDRPLGPEPAELNAAVRAYLNEARRHLLEIHDRGVPARQVNEEHSDLIDRLVRKIFRVSGEAYHARFPRLDVPVAVLATGGYGRQELALASDIDLLVLYANRMTPYAETIREALLYRFSDANVPVSVPPRTVAECLRFGDQDLSTLTSYLDARLLIGDVELAAGFEGAVRARIRENSTAFIEAKLQEQRGRHERFRESPYLLQPNVRESVGALRDAHTALWVARAANWEIRKPEHLHVHGFLDEQELADLLAALDFLWRVRNELHRSGRKDDRLHFEVQEHVAEFLGFEGTQRTFPVEQFMQAYYLHARAVQRISGRVVAHAFRLEERRAGQTRPAPRPLEEGFVLADGCLEIPHARLLEERPVRMLSAFALAQRHQVELSARAQRLIQQHVGLIDDELREHPEAAALFRQILQAENRVYRTLAAMNELGVLGAYLPEFGEIVGLWQQDLYHTYTVDAHSLFLVEQIRRLERGRYNEELELATKLVREIKNRDVLLLGCLLHDIGKGKGGDHSARGARVVPEIGRRLGLRREEIEDVSFLVLNHLHMSRLAERRDVDGSRLIINFAKLVESRGRLRNLYLLTVADIRSVSSEAWTSWKRRLLETLYRNTADWLEAGVADETAPRYLLERAIERAGEIQAEVLGELADAGIATDRAELFLESLPKRYWLTHSTEEIADHVEAYLAYVDDGGRVGVHVHRPGGTEASSCEMVVFAEDRLGLFATVSGLLAAAGRNILSAHVYTTRGGLAMEIYQLAALGPGIEEEETDRARLERRLLDVIENRRTVEALILARPPSRPRPVRVRPPSVRISNEDSDFYSIVDVEADDRSGLLYDITRTLTEVGVNVVISRASTRASRVSDAFYVNEDGHKILDEERMREIERAVLAAVEPGAA